MAGGRRDERGGHLILTAAVAAVLIDAVEPQMRDELVPRGDGSSDVERKYHLRGISEIEGYSAPLDHSANGIAPFNIERPASS